MSKQDTNKPSVLPNTDDADAWTVLAAVRACAMSWEPEARIIGNVRAGDIARAIREIAVFCHDCSQSET